MAKVTEMNTLAKHTAMELYIQNATLYPDSPQHLCWNHWGNHVVHKDSVVFVLFAINKYVMTWFDVWKMYNLVLADFYLQEKL